MIIMQHYFQRSLTQLVLMLLIISPQVACAQGSSNGFIIETPLIPRNEIYHGGPPRDGIPSLDQPIFITAIQNQDLSDNERVLALSYQGVHKAYPIRILDYHELVNDRFNGAPVLISYCPLCATGMAFDANIANQALQFGVSGLLYNSDVLMYDRTTDSLWSQLLQTAISGKLKGTRLKMLPLEHTSWGDWRQRYPDTLLLSFNTSHQYNYFKTLYKGYPNSKKIYFPVKHQDKRYHPKEVVVGVNINGSTKAYPFIELSKATQPVQDNIAGKTLTIEFDQSNRSARVVDAGKQLIPSVTAYWFAWYTFKPEPVLVP